MKTKCGCGNKNTDRYLRANCLKNPLGQPLVQSCENTLKDQTEIRAEGALAVPLITTHGYLLLSGWIRLQFFGKRRRKIFF